MATTASASTSIDLSDIHQRALQATRPFVAGVPSDQWSAPTNCDMDVRSLVNHIVAGHYWAVELLSGKTIADVGSALDGDVLGDDAVAEYERAASAAVAAFGQPGAMEQICHLSYGDVPGAVYCSHRILDVFIHGWDVARATGQNATLDPELVDVVYAMFKPHAEMLQASGAFGTPVDVPPESDPQTLLLAMLGRDNRS